MQDVPTGSRPSPDHSQDLSGETLEFAKKSLEANLQSSDIEVDDEVDALTQEARKAYNEYIRDMGGEYMWLTSPGTLEDGLFVARRILKGMNSREKEGFDGEKRRSDAHDALETFVENYERIYEQVDGDASGDELVYDDDPYNDDKEFLDIDGRLRIKPEALYQMSLDHEED